MDSDRRRELHTNAGGDDDEEKNGVAIRRHAAAQRVHVGSERPMKDTDVSGLVLRLGLPHVGSARQAEDARPVTVRWTHQRQRRTVLQAARRTPIQPP